MRALAILAVMVVPVMAAADQRVPLRNGWTLQSAARIAATGDTLSKPGVDTSAWHKVTVPNTVVGALVENGTYPDPYFAMNLRKIPGTTYPIGERFTLLPMPADSPFKPSWWYRTEFTVQPGAANRQVSLHFDGINYRANIWLNGTQLASARDVAGVFRRYEMDVTQHLHASGSNVLAVEVIAPEPHDLSIMWVDWNPTPPDKNMGLWGDVYLTESGPIALRDPLVVPALAVPALDRATLTISADVWNRTDAAVTGVVRGSIETIRFEERVTLGPRERKRVTFSPDRFTQLAIAGPRVWWPYRMGRQELYTLSLTADANGAASDAKQVTFGIQHMSSELTAEGHRLFKVNGKPILVRGGGWASDMLLRPKSTDRLEAELRYVREMGLNTIRLEGKLETDEFYDLADRYGVLIMAGWCCCDQWELWDKWDEEDHRVGPASLRDQILRMRNHPSMLVWLNGSDFPPPAKVERAYLDVLSELQWPKPILSNATGTAGPVSGPSGVKMLGPYDYVPPGYWLTDKKNGGAFGFATEIGPGAAVPPIESLKRIVPADRLWPMNDVWTYHAGGDEFKDLKLFTAALDARYGKPRDLEDFTRKAQALAYEGQRAMFEAYGGNRYRSTGVIQWMLNNAWPSMIWHLYDYFLRPAGGYYGTKKACEPLHVQYAYDNGAVVVVNDRQEAVKGLRVSAQVFDLNLVPKFSKDDVIDLPADSVARPFTIPVPAVSTTTYFVRLTLTDAASPSAAPLSTNFYWLSTKPDVLDWNNAKWFYTPTKSHADLKALSQLPATRLSIVARADAGAKDSAIVTVENSGQALAFQVHLKLVDGSTGEEPLPVYWDDNYFALMPGEKREIRVSTPLAAKSAALAVEARAWNVPAMKVALGAERQADSPGDDKYRFQGRGGAQSIALAARDGAMTWTWPAIPPASWDTGFIGLRVSADASVDSPVVRISAGSTQIDQHLDRGARGLRWLNLSSLRGRLSPGTTVEIRGDGVTIASDATLRTFDNRLDLSQRILVLAPHPDDAELAAFGLYADRQATVVTVTSGNAGDFNYRDNVSDPAEHYQLKGYLRAVDSVTVPWQGGIPPDRTYNMGYFDARLKEMRSRPSEPVAEVYGPNQDVAVYRRANLSTMLPNESRTATWNHLVEDLVAVLTRVNPSIVVMAHPALDNHPDHQFASVALAEALERWNGRATFLLYTNHASENLYPFGPPDTFVPLPPWSASEIAVQSLYVHPLDATLQRRKLFALESHHDLRLSPAEQASCGIPGLKRRDDYPRTPAVDYFRRAPRPEELFFVFDRDGVRNVIKTFLASPAAGAGQ
jgi:exo-1,4-beta-D-glucosaminidase